MKKNQKTRQQNSAATIGPNEALTTTAKEQNMFVITQNGDVIGATEDTAKEISGEHPDSFIVSSEADLEEVPTPVLLSVYNQANPEGKIKKFADRETAVKKAFEAISGEGASEEEAEVKADPKPKKAKKEPKPKKERSTNSLIGKRIIPTALGLESRRQGESRRTRSFGIIESNPGLTYEQYIAKGGHPQDLSILVTRRRHATLVGMDEKLPEEPPQVDDPKGIAQRAAVRVAEAEKRAAEKAAEKKAKAVAAEAAAKAEAAVKAEAEEEPKGKGKGKKKG